MNTGNRIKKLRESLELTQTELAKNVRISKQTLYKYENGIVTNIPSNKLELLADSLKTTPEYLVGWTDDQTDYEKLEIDVPTWWEGSIKGYIEYQEALDEDRAKDSLRIKNILLYKNIKNMRISKEMSQDTLASLTGYSDRSSIAKIEKGLVDLQESKIKLFAEALGTTPAKLMGWESDYDFQDTVAGHLDTDGLSQEDLDDVAQYIDFIKNRKK